MSRNLHLGAASISFSQPLYIESAASIVSQKEADGPLGDFFDLICKDPMFGCGTWESAESTLQKETATLAMNKAGLDFEDIHLMFAGDLLAQTAATCFGSAGLGIPFYGLYGACSTMGESLSLGCLALTAGFGTRVLCALFCHLDCNRKRRLYSEHSPSRGKISSALRQRLRCHHWTYGRPGHGLRTQRFHEYGRMYGSCCLRHHCPELFRFRAEAFGLRCRLYRGSGEHRAKNSPGSSVRTEHPALTHS